MENVDLGLLQLTQIDYCITFSAPDSQSTRASPYSKALNYTSFPSVIYRLGLIQFTQTKYSITISAPDTHSTWVSPHSQALLHSYRLGVLVHVDDVLPVALGVPGALRPRILNLRGTQESAVLREVPVCVVLRPLAPGR